MNLINTNQTLHLFPLNDNPEDPEYNFIIYFIKSIWFRWNSLML